MAEEQESPARMLVRALNELKPDERDTVLAWLFERVPETTVPTASALVPELRRSLPHRWSEFQSVEASLTSAWGEMARQDLKMVPVRMPVDLHARLRDWCEAHGFSMATVVRGLLGRFLDEQGQTPTKPKPEEDAG
jgi:hypothetical protein